MSEAEKKGGNGRKPPYTYRERELFEYARRILGHAKFGITDDLTELGLTEEGIRQLVSTAAGEGIEITAEDVRKYRTIDRIVKKTESICYFEGGYDPEKPVLVLVYGLARLVYYMPVLEQLKERFSILAIEPIVEHYRYVFQKEHIQEVIDFYEDLILYFLPEGADVYAFLGYSFGGDAAYRLACRWEERRGKRPFVYMIDTYKHVYDSRTMEEYKEEVLSRLDKKERLAAEIFWKLGCYCIDIPKELGDGRELPHYGGPVRLFSATQIKEEPALAGVLHVKAVMREENPNIQAWRELAPDLTVDFIDADHLTIIQAPEFKSVFFGRIDSDLA